MTEKGAKSLSPSMADDFQHALKWHLDTHGTKVVDLARSTGVSRDVINKMLRRDNASTTVENGMMIAAFYGKTVNQFIACEDASDEDRFSALYLMLRPEERQLLEAQISGILASRAEKSSAP